jgi:hypothetical protein
MNTRMRPLLLTAGLVATIAGPATIGIARAVGATTTGAPLTADEIAALRSAREEEKLARDLYRAFAKTYRSRVFSNIILAEEKHLDAVLTLLTTYGVADPIGANADGVFTDADLQRTYTSLLARGSVSFTDALLTGAYVEELDLHDLEQSPLYASNHPDIAQTLANLHAGSENHLRAFVRSWERQTGRVYLPQLLDADEVDRILGR